MANTIIGIITGLITGVGITLFSSFLSTKRENDKWAKEKIYEIYSRATSSFTELIQEVSTSRTRTQNIPQAFYKLMDSLSDLLLAGFRHFWIKKQPQIPLFTKQIALGLVVAEELNYKSTTQESFGTNRCQIIANGLLESWKSAETSSDIKLAL